MFLNESSFAVLSVPSFSMQGPYAESFTNSVGKFLNLSREAGLQKIIIDLQGNGGGDAVLATDLFKHVSGTSCSVDVFDIFNSSSPS